MTEISFKLPPPRSHKGDNGKVLVVGGSDLFHGAPLWALKVLSRLVDMVFFASVSEVKSVVDQLKVRLWDFIYIPRQNIDDYANEADIIVYGPGMRRDVNKLNYSKNKPIDWSNTYQVLDYLSQTYGQRKWLIDAGGLQVMPIEWLGRFKRVIVTPHRREFENLFKDKLTGRVDKDKEIVSQTAARHKLTILLTGRVDIIAGASGQVKLNTTGNQGMTKGGSGDVLAGLVAGLWVYNSAFTAAWTGAYLNGLAGDKLYQSCGPFYNTSDLTDKLIQVLINEIKKD